MNNQVETTYSLLVNCCQDWQPNSEVKDADSKLLMEEIRKIISDSLQTDSLKSDANKIVQQLAKHDPKICLAVHKALFGVNNDKFELLDQTLTCEIIDELQSIISDSNEQKSKRLTKWLQMNSSYFTSDTIASLSKEQKLQLTALLAQLPSAKRNTQNIYNLLDPNHLNLFENNWNAKNICKNLLSANLAKEEYPIFLAHFISCKKIPIKDLNLDRATLEAIMPYLHYGDFRKIDDENLIIDLLKKGNNLSHIFINNNKIKELPALPFCKELTCFGCIRLTSLPALPLCEKLTCFGCTRLTSLPALPLCKKLTCSGCIRLTSLPALPLCERLTCYGCIRLTSLPALPLCKELTCPSCTRLTSLLALPLCERLTCFGCTGLTSLPALPLCKELTCYDCTPLTSLPNLPLCKELTCFGCTGLTSLPALPLCEKLTCFSCTGLTSLPALPLCEELTCLSCTGLTSLPALPLCKELTCYGCTGLTSLPNLPLCKELRCFGCTGLTSLPALPLCEELTCYGCTGLTSLPHGLPVCQYLNCEDCPLLTELPEVPHSCQVLTGQSSTLQFASMTVEMEDIAKKPKISLLALGREFLLKNKPFPNIVYTENKKLSVAIDIGGVRRDMISRLMGSLFVKEDNEHLAIESGWPLLQQGEEDCYRTLGRIFALCYPKNSFFKPGYIFPDAVFKFIAKTENPASPSQDEWISLYLDLHEISQNVLKLCNSDASFDFKDSSFLTQACYLYDDQWDKTMSDHDPKEFFQDPNNRKELAHRILEKAQKNEKLQAVICIAKEMKLSLGEIQWADLRKEPELLAEKVQGIVSRQSLLEALTWKQGNSVQQTQHNQTKEFMENWINKATLDELRSFVFAVTGNKALGKTSQLKIETHNRDSLPVAHTCFFTLELTAEKASQDDFDNMMKTFLEYAVTRFGLA